MKLYGSGFRNCYGGITYGFSRPIGNDTEVVIVEYRRIPQKHNKSMVVDVLSKKLRTEVTEDGFSVEVTDAMERRVKKRMAKWTKQLSQHFVGT